MLDSSWIIQSVIRSWGVQNFICERHAVKKTVNTGYKTWLWYYFATDISCNCNPDNFVKVSMVMWCCFCWFCSPWTPSGCRPPRRAPPPPPPRRKKRTTPSTPPTRPSQPPRQQQQRSNRRQQTRRRRWRPLWWPITDQRTWIGEMPNLSSYVTCSKNPRQIEKLWWFMQNNDIISKFSHDKARRVVSCFTGGSMGLFIDKLFIGLRRCDRRYFLNPPLLQ